MGKLLLHWSTWPGFAVLHWQISKPWMPNILYYNNPVSPLQRISRTMRTSSQRKSLSGTPTTSWTRLRLQTQKKLQVWWRRSIAVWTATLPQNLITRCVCMFAGELLKEMTVDYERSTSEDRLDEVLMSHSECVSAKETNPNHPSPRNHVWKKYSWRTIYKKKPNRKT